MAYVINKFNGEQLVVLQDGTLDTTTSLNLVGRNYVGYGESQNENFVYLLENFANQSPPSRPIKGQIWFNITDNIAYSYDGDQWNPIGSATVSSTNPANTNPGTLWFKTPVNQLFVYTGTEWRLIGPESVEGFSSTKARSASIDDINGDPRPVIFLETDGVPFAICAHQTFIINPSNYVEGFPATLQIGINLSNLAKINGSITGNAATSDELSTARLINGIPFNGTTDITVKSATTNLLKTGNYITGSNFDGSIERTWSVDASSSNIIGKVVARDSEGGFSAGTISANFVGNLTGNVISTSGTSSFNVVQANQFVGATLSGNATTATKLATARTINNIIFDGTQNITVTAEADTLTGGTLAPNVISSSLTTVGTLDSLSVSGPINFTNGLQISSPTGGVATLGIAGTVQFVAGPNPYGSGGATTSIALVNGNSNLSVGGTSNNIGAILPGLGNITDIGNPSLRFNYLYADVKGNSDTATLAIRSTNLAGGGLGAIPYQSSTNTTTMLGLGADGYVLRARPGGPQWEALAGLESLAKGSYLNFVNTATSASLNSFNGTVGVTISVDASSTNNANKVVVRDSSGNFAAGTITANIVGNVSGNASTATKLVTPRQINGVNFDGTANITINASDSTKLAKSGDSMSGFLTLHASPTSNLHAATKQYVDTRLPQYTFTYGQVGCVGYTNQVGSFNDGSNYFDVFPPSGKSMSNLVAFIPSLRTVYYAGGVDGNDAIRTNYSVLGDRIRVWVQNTEQRSTPTGNYLAIWS